MHRIAHKLREHPDVRISHTSQQRRTSMATGVAAHPWLDIQVVRNQLGVRITIVISIFVRRHCEAKLVARLRLSFVKVPDFAIRDDFTLNFFDDIGLLLVRVPQDTQAFFPWDDSVRPAGVLVRV